MGGKVVWLALAFMLMFEGLMPLLAPQRWRRLFARMLELADPQLRVYGLVSVLAGLAMYWLLA